MRYILLTGLIVVVAGCQLSGQTKLPRYVSSPAEILQEQSESLAGSLELETELRNLFDETVIATGDYVYPVAQYTTLRSKVFGQYQAATADQAGGYATGDEIVITDNAVPVPVYALTTAKIIRQEAMPGYGGVVILEFTEGLTTYHALYQQVDLSTVSTVVGQSVAKGTVLGYVTAADPAQLFFSIYNYSGTELFSKWTDQNADLELWVNPADFLREYQAVELVVSAT